jgi:GDSL-like lipase/acylhydrolase family protein
MELRRRTMKNTLFYALPALVLSMVLFSACTEEAAVNDPSNGLIVNQSYVAIGDNASAGFQSGALNEYAQEYSYPNLIAQQIGASFVQPLLPGDGTGTIIKIVSMSPPTLETSAFKAATPLNVNHPVPYNNLSIPMAIISDADDSSDVNQRAAERSNPFYPTVMRTQAAFGYSLIDQAVILQPTFITFALGGYDVMGYAIYGGTRGTDATGTLPTDGDDFKKNFKKALDLLTERAANAKVIVANIPDITTMPYFTRIPHLVPHPANPGQYLDIYITDSQGAVRKAGVGDMILLTAQSLLADTTNTIGLLPTTPLSSVFVLDTDEKSKALAAISEFNKTIKSEADAHGFAFVDLHALYDQMSKGEYDIIAGEKFSGEFITGGFYSLDGIHPSSKGSAIVANAFIDVMNAQFQANIRKVSISQIPGIPVPLTK